MKQTLGHKLLSRDDFRNMVFERDNHRCVICDSPAQDAHHILERRLWPDGGYYLDNGASVCGPCHIKCEETTISVITVREACGINKPIIPPHLYYDQEYDKWGNPVLPNGTRLKGDLFNDESVQKILEQGKVLDLFTHYVKYPRTLHLIFSPGLTKDDRVHESHEHWHCKDIVVTTKMDGENTTMYSDYIHARSVNSGNHPSRNRLKAFHASIQGDIPSGWRICGENLYAKHSIFYDNLEAYFLGFSVWTDKNICLGWDDTLEWFELIGIKHVPVLYEGVYDEKVLKDIEAKMNFDKDEGFVVRTRDQFHYKDFKQCVGKYVRENHVQTTRHHWKAQPVIPNQTR